MIALPAKQYGAATNQLLGRFEKMGQTIHRGRSKDRDTLEKLYEAAM